MSKNFRVYLKFKSINLSGPVQNFYFSINKLRYHNRTKGTIINKLMGIPHHTVLKGKN